MPRLRLVLLAAVAAVPFAQAAEPAAAPPPTPVLVIHGGAGVPSGLKPEQAQAIRAALELALRRGHAALAAGKPAIDAVTAAITTLEDDPNFNAGRGAVFTHDGRNELDAAVMEGDSLKAGAVAGVHRVKNPILLARTVLEKSPHVLLVGDGAEVFAKEQGIELVDPSYFRTERRWQELQKALQEERDRQARIDPSVQAERHRGTVGAVALDAAGHLAAGTSTGGMTNKRYGRVGDSPIIGAGTYANGECAVSGTGWGEFYLRTVAAYSVCERMHYLHESPAQAGEAVIDHDVPALGGDGGAIVLDRQGRIALPYNTEGMARGWIGADGVPHVAIYKDDPLPMP
ncbi:MAG: isoaspartyl peptidase/L-asparaginase [Pseudoxanthomonas sp.]